MKLKLRWPDREGLLASRWIRPFAHRLQDPQLWHLSRESTARGLALGLFIGFLVPIAQTPLAAFFAISIRGHLITAAAATFVTNPLTIPFIYYAALRCGERVLSAGHFTPAATESLIGKAFSFAAPIAVGLALFAIIFSLAAYWGVRLGWRIWTIWRWRKRSGRRIALGSEAA